MQMTFLTRACVAFASASISAGVAFAASEAPQQRLSEIDAPDGTYRIENVTSFEDCVALCEADKGTCTGSFFYEIQDGDKHEKQCHLNNGIGDNTAFPRPEVKDLDLAIATAEFNAYRVSHGLKALKNEERLNRASEVHARDLASAGILSHTGTDGSTHGDRIQLQGYYFSIAAENAAAGQTSWEAAFQGWKDSKGHNENMLRDDVSEFGLALVSAPKSKFPTYWVMVLADPIDINAPVFPEPEAAE